VEAITEKRGYIYVYSEVDTAARLAAGLVGF
jgi:hypothetical protein